MVDCRICNWEVAGSNLGLGYFAPRSTQPSIPTGSANEYQLRLGRQRQVWLSQTADERVGVQVKRWNPLRTRAILERFCGGDSLRRDAISNVCTFNFMLPHHQKIQKQQNRHSVCYCLFDYILEAASTVTICDGALESVLRAIEIIVVLLLGLLLLDMWLWKEYGWCMYVQLTGRRIPVPVFIEISSTDYVSDEPFWLIMMSATRSRSPQYGQFMVCRLMEVHQLNRSLKFYCSIQKLSLFQLLLGNSLSSFRAVYTAGEYNNVFLLNGVFPNIKHSTQLEGRPP